MITRSVIEGAMRVSYRYDPDDSLAAEVWHGDAGGRGRRAWAGR